MFAGKRVPNKAHQSAFWPRFSAVSLGRAPRAKDAIPVFQSMVTYLSNTHPAE